MENQLQSQQLTSPDQIKISEKFEPLFNIPKGVNIFILTGGRYSQKSFATSLAVVNGCFAYNFRTLYTRYTNVSSKDSILPEIEEKIDMLGYTNLFNSGNNRFESLVNDSKIVLKGLKPGSGIQTANLKGFKDFSVWVLDEAEELVDETVFDKMLLSIRGNTKDDDIPNIVVLIMNPASKEHFVYQKYFLGKGVSEGFNGVKDNVCYIHTTYKDCIEFVPQEFIDYFEDMRLNNPKKYHHVVEGGWLDKAEGVVFTNWEYGRFNPDNLQTSFGQDFGFSIDPSTLVEVAIDKKKKIIYVKEHLYKPKLTTSQIAQINLRVAGNKLIIADSAEPRLIEELKGRGCNIRATEKGQGSISAGIALMSDFKIVVDPSSTNVAKELNNYVYADKGSKLYVDDFNHIIDAVRYNVFFHLSNPNKGKYFVY